MSERYKEKNLSGSVVSRQYGSMLIADYDRNISEGTEKVEIRFKTIARTIDTSADTITGEEEIAPVSQLSDLGVDTSSLSGRLDNAGLDPVTGTDLSNISKAGVLKWMKALFNHELDRVMNS